ncbi:tRNA pseudouridine(13) synthase TruD, partial [Candidatus Woesearchaeota archaeon]
MYVIKHAPEDFIVEELLDTQSLTGKMSSKITGKLTGKMTGKMTGEMTGEGAYLLVQVTKREWNTESLAAEFARLLGIRRAAVGYAGAKDKLAVATQHFTLKGVSRERVARLAIPRVTLRVLGVVKEPLGLGSLQGNKFTITIRNLTNEELALPPCVPNYFDEQRFSSHNAAIGEALLRGSFAKAVALVEASGSPHAQAMQRFFRETNDAVGALLRLPRQHLRLYLHAYQSLLWNRMLTAYIRSSTSRYWRTTYSLGELLFPEERIADTVLPLPGFGVTGTTPIAAQLLDEVLAAAQLSPRNFIIKQLPNLSLEGDERRALVTVQDFAL